MPVDQNISSRINLMRILLISGIVFVHVPYDLDASPFIEPNGFFDWVRVFLGESLFRIGVPCLSAISGYLLFHKGLETFDYRRTLLSKSRTVLLPFLLWNFAALLFVLLIQHFGMGIGYFPDLWGSSFGEWLNHTLAFNDFPVNLPLYFLRDLMVCILISPILAFLVRRVPTAVLGVLFLVAVFPALTSGIVLKQSILFSFTLGIFFALYRVDLKRLDPYALPIAALVLALAAVLALGLFNTGPDYPDTLNILRNTLAILGAVGFWVISAPLVRTRLGQRMANSGSLSFWTFCAHYPLLVLLWMVWNRHADAALYPVFYVVSVLITFTALIISNRLALRYVPGLYEVLTGSRGRRRSSSSPSRQVETLGSGRAAATQQQR
ncbi:acyltransferase [Rhizobium sp. SGZ-381]|uniref:acyltransferase family protein n=1 Tax=Rhizobium sp. SGZ-381 TaxID=3342800 RepID=UPI00366F5D69